MTELEKILFNITKVIDEYKSGSYNTLDRLRELLRELSTSRYYVTKENIEAYDMWANLVYNRSDNESVSAAKIRADVKYPHRS
jgi:hypothetical protein